MSDVTVSSNANSRKRAFTLIILFGIISLFSDMTYQAGRSLNGPFLSLLGANAALVGLIAGLGELLGYGLRLATGWLVDKSRAYWAFTIIGYSLIAAVPLLALAGRWQVAALFIVIERLSKAVRAPAKDTILSMAARRVGTGYGFGLHKIMDQTGAILGPLLMSLILSGILGNVAKNIESYHLAFSLLWIPFGLTLLFVLIGRRNIPKPLKLEAELQEIGATNPAPPVGSEKLSRTFWIYSIFTILTGMGFVNFALLSFHAVHTHLLEDAAVPLWYAFAMAANGIAAFITGRWYDNRGLSVLYAVPLLSIPLPFLGFLGNSPLLLVITILLWGASLGIQETVIKAGIADLTPLNKRGTGYGIFNTMNGIGLLASGVVMGFLYESSPWAVCVFTAVTEIAGCMVLFFLLKKKV